jgi:hypothetical protein
MNQKFTINVVAILVTFSGAISLCDAKQVPVSRGAARPATFGGVTAAQPPVDDANRTGLPPIVSSASYSGSTELPSAPPIISAAPPIFQPSRVAAEPPIVAAADSTSMPPIVAAPDSNSMPPIVSVAPNSERATDRIGQFPSRNEAENSSPKFESKLLAPIVLDQAPPQTAPGQAEPDPIQSNDADSVRTAAQWNSPTNQPIGVPVNGVSSAGIPLYPRQPMPKSADESTSPEQDATQLKAPKIKGTKISPAEGSSTNLPSAETEKPNGSSARVSRASTQIPTSQTYFNAPAQEAPVISGAENYCVYCGGVGCPNCGGGSYGASGVGTANANNYNLGGYNAQNQQARDPNFVDSKGSRAFDYVHDQYGYFGSVTGARWYVEADAFYIDRTDGTIVNSNFGSLGDFDEDAGLKVTIGRRRDVTRGFEASFFGTVPLEQSVTRLDADGRIRTLFNFDVLTIDSPFFGAVQQDEFKRTEFYAAELNRTKWAWDVVKASYGLRAFYIDDEYATVLINSVGDIGTYDIRTRNICVGPHIGSEWFYDIGYRFSFSYFGKLGGFVNWNRVENEVTQVGVALSDSRDDNVTVGSYAELGFIGHFQITRRLRARFGYNVLYIDQVAGVSDNQPVVLNSQTLVNSSDSGQMSYSGVSIGLEFYR